MNREGINKNLFESVFNPPTWASDPDGEDSSPYFLTKPTHKKLIPSFLDATTDAVRLVRASEASREILDEYAMAELEELRATIQASELLRVIPYPRQTDHSAHTLYLFLLGIHLFLTCPPLRAGIAKFLRKKNDTAELVDSFLFQWIFVSLLHDIGYIFQGRSKNEIRAVDRMFRASTITRLMGSASRGLKQSVTKAIADLKTKPFEPIENPEDMLSALRYMPWESSSSSTNDIFQVFRNHGPQDQQITSNDLEDYAYRVASNGYDGFSEGTVDHAVASGLFLYRYSAFWYWLAEQHGFEDVFASYREGYNKRDVTCACFATAAHNIIGVHSKWLTPINFETNPMIYLGVLCDELQKWDRFPAGERHIVDLKSFERYCTDSERINAIPIPGDDKVVFKIIENRLAASIKGVLNERLDRIGRFIKINPTSGDELISDDEIIVPSAS